MPLIEVDNETAQRVAAQAAAHGLSPAEYLRTAIAALPTNRAGLNASDELDAELQELALELPTLPEDVSRADIYNDRD